MPNYPCNPGSGLANKQRANVACFSLPSFTGNSIIDNGPRNLPYLSGPSYFDSDLALYKTFHVTERQSIQFRASAFNWLNHPLPIFSNGGLLQLKLFPALKRWASDCRRCAAGGRFEPGS